MFIAAMLYAPAATTPVRIRNMSVEGALLDCATLPPSGTIIRLVRGALSVQGTIRWSKNGRCGIRFSSRINIPEWLKPFSHQQQHRVDEVVSALRSGARPLPVGCWSGPQAVSDIEATVQVELDLHQVSQLLEKLGSELIDDPVILASHHECIQDIDIAVQTLRAAANLLAHPEDDPSAVQRLANLRTSCAQSLARLPMDVNPAA